MVREMKDSGVQWIGEIPTDWNVVIFSKLGKQIKDSNKGLIENNLLSLSYGRIVKKNIDTTFGLLPESFETYNIIEQNDIVLRLTDLQNDHKSLRVGLSSERGIITSAYITVRLNDTILPKYMYYQLHSFDVCKGFYGMGAGVRQGLNWEEVKRLQIIVPSEEEQHRIVSFLDSKCAEIDKAVEATKSSIEEYKKLRQAIITEAVTKGLDPTVEMKDSGIEWLGYIPKAWGVRQLKSCVNVLRGGSPRPIDEYLTDDIDGLNWIKIGDTEKGKRYINSVRQKIKKSGLSKTRQVHRGDLLLTNSMSFGEPYILNVDGCIHDGWLVFTDIKEIDKEYLYYFLLSSTCKDQFSITADGGVVQNLNIEKVQSSIILLPVISEQHKIVDYLNTKCSEIDSLIKSKEKLIEELTAYRKSLIYEYVTGKKEVPVESA